MRCHVGRGESMSKLTSSQRHRWAPLADGLSLPPDGSKEPVALDAGEDTNPVPIETVLAQLRRAEGQRRPVDVEGPRPLVVSGTGKARRHGIQRATSYNTGGRPSRRRTDKWTGTGRRQYLNPRISFCVASTGRNHD